MLRVLIEIETLYGVPQGTMRSAISRGVIQAVKRGKITMVDDRDPTFETYLQSYQPRGGRSLSPSAQTAFTSENAAQAQSAQTLLSTP